MNKKLKITLKNCSDEQGFAIPIAVGIGLIMILVGVTMIVRSQGDQTTASAQKATAQSLAITEGGLTRTLSTLNQPNNASFLKLNYDTVNSATAKTYLGPDGIPNNGDGEGSAVDQWSNPPNPAPCSTPGSLPSGLVSGTMGSGNYQIRAYRYRDPDGSPNNGDEIGTLLIEGKQGETLSQVQVSMPIVQSPQAGTFAGLYASNTINLGGNDIMVTSGGTGSAANVICRDCVVPVDECSGGVPTQAGLDSAVGRNNRSVIDGKIIVGDPQLPAVPTAPATVCSSTSGVNCQINIGSISGGSLPRSGDITDRASWRATNPAAWPASTASEPYHYVITDMPIGNNILTVDTTTAPVYLYVSGDVSLNGTGGIAHSGTSDRLRLYGNPADPTDSTTDQSISISGGSSASHIFIYAPDATVGINGGSNTPDILGAVWAKTWDGSSGNNADIQVPDNMPSLLGGSFSGVGMQSYGSSAPSNWQQHPVTTQ